MDVFLAAAARDVWPFPDVGATTPIPLPLPLPLPLPFHGLAPHRLSFLTIEPSASARLPMARGVLIVRPVPMRLVALILVALLGTAGAAEAQTRPTTNRVRVAQIQTAVE